MDVLELNVWKGDWGLASIDVECLQVLAYAKFNGIPLKINACSNPYNTPNGKLPVLKYSAGTCDTAKDIIEYFRQRNYNMEYELNGKQCSKIMAYEAMLKEKLLPALQFIWWIDERNVNNLIRPWYYKAIPLPFKFYYPVKYEKQARVMCETLHSPRDDASITDIENKVYLEAQKCLTTLSMILGNSDYFLDNKPTALDAIVYSYLAPLLSIPLENKALQNHLIACTNLENFISRIRQKYFEKEYKAYVSKQTLQATESELPDKRRNQIIAGCVAILAMATFFFTTDILVFLEKDNEEDTSVVYE